MQPHAPSMTPFEEHITQSYQLLNAARLSSVMMYHGANFCMDKCLDTEELYTLLRTTRAPFKYRLQKDLEEKDCVQHCGMKWVQLVSLTMQQVNETATKEVQSQAVAHMWQQMQKGGGADPK